MSPSPAGTDADSAPGGATSDAPRSDPAGDPNRVVVSFMPLDASIGSKGLGRLTAPAGDRDLLALDDMTGCVTAGVLAVIAIGICLWLAHPLSTLLLAMSALAVGVWRWTRRRPPAWIAWEDGFLVEAPRFPAGEGRRWSRAQVSSVTWSPRGMIRLHRRDGGIDGLPWPTTASSVQEAAIFIADGFGFTAVRDGR